MADSKLPDRVSVVLAGREMWVRRPTDAQVTLIHRYGKISSSAATRHEALGDGDGDSEERAALLDKAIGGVADVLDVLERLVIGIDDREYLQEAMKDGVLDLAQMQAIPEAFRAANSKGDTGAKAQLIE